MVRFVCALLVPLALSAPASAATAVDATVTVYTPDQGGVIPPELRAAASTLQRKGYTGASMVGRERVHLVTGELTPVDAGDRPLELQLVSVADGKAQVRVVRETGATLTAVSLADPRFYVIVER